MSVGDLPRTKNRAKHAGAQERRLRLSALSWTAYLHMLRACEGTRVRITYDRGELEVMTLSPQHEWLTSLLGQLVEVLTDELNMSRRSAAQMTLKRRKKRRGLEADRSYYIQNEPKVRLRDVIDLTRDPPPDLAIEVEISTSLLDRIEVYKALRVPEIWRYDGSVIQVLLLSEQGEYVESPTSLAFPFLRVQELVRFLDMRHQLGETEPLRQFREWVRQQQAAGWKVT